MTLKGNEIVSGSLIVTNGISGSFFGTSSQAVSSSYAYTASSAINASASLIAVSASYAYTASSAIRASASLIATSASYSYTASSAILASASLIAVSSSYAYTASSAILASASLISISSSYAYTASSAILASASLIAISASYAYTASSAILASASLIAISSSYAYTASSAILASASLIATSASYAYTASSAILASASLIATSASYAYTASSAISSSFANSGTGRFSGSFTGSFNGSFSGSISNLNGATNHIAFFDTPNTISSSALYQSGGYSIIINQENATTAAPEALYVWQPSTSSFNVISGKGNLNNYLQLNIQNVNAGTSASSDVVATAGNGDELSRYIDMGINGENFVDNGSGVGAANDSYLYATGNKLYLGNLTTQSVHLFVGTGSAYSGTKLLLKSNNLHELTGSLNISSSLVVGNGITGSLFGTASQAVSASYAYTASSAISASFAVNYLGSGSISTRLTNLETASGSFSTRVTNTETTASNLVAASSSFSTRITSDSSSFSSRVSSLEATTASLQVASASFSTRVTNTETTASNLVAASASFSTRTTVLEGASGSFSTRVTNTETTASNLVAASASFSTRTTSLEGASGSFSTRVTQIEKTYATTGSNIFTGSQNILGAITASAALINGTLTAQTLVVTTVSSSVVYSSGSNVFGNSTANTQTFTGSVNISGSLTLVGRGTINDLTGSLFGTSSWASGSISSSYAYTASSAIVASASLIAVSASYAYTASSAILASASLIAVSSSYAFTASSAIVASASLIAVSSSYAFTASSAISSSYAFTASSAINASASLIAVSASYAYTASSAIRASASLIATSASYAYTASSAIVASASLIAISASYAYTASSAIVASASLIATSASYAFTASSAILASASLIATSASYSFTASSAISASVAQTASFVNPLRQIVTITGSLNVSGSTTQVGTNNLFGNTSLSGSLTISGSQGTAPTINIFGDVNQTGYTRYLPVTTNINTSISASYIYVSGSTNDLYFSQNGNGYNNVTRLRWLEGNLYTGLLNGGLITVVTGSTYFSVASGSGVIVNLNASLTDNPYPTIAYINWPTFTSQSLTYLTSSVQTFLGIDSNAQIIQQTDPFSDGQYNTAISLGTVLHQNQTTINASITYPNVAYGWKQRSYDFVKAFGPLKLSGYTLAPSGSSTGSLIVGSGTAFADGRNYQTDPNNPSYITDQGTNVSKIFRYYQSGSGFVQDTNAGLGFTSVDSSRYNNNGTLTSISPSTPWSIQRVFWYPNSATKGIVVYYGNAQYASETEAIANIQYESFTETPNTQQNAIYLAALVLKYNADFTDPTTYTILPAGIFRSVGGSGGGGSVVTTTLAGLSDVSITGPTDHQPLAYDTTLGKWTNQSSISASIAGNAQTATSASQATSASYAYTASSAISASFAVNYLGSGSISTRLTNLETASGSFSTRVTNTETTASNLVAASASFSTRITNDSSSLSARVTRTEATASNLVAASASFSTRTTVLEGASGSFSTRVTQIERTYATTGSNIYTGSQNILGAITASAALINGTLTAQTLVVTTVSSSVIYSSGSNRFGDDTSDIQTFTGSVNISGSLTLVGRGTINDLTGSLFGTSSWSSGSISASYAYTASSAIVASASLIAISSSYAYTASSAINASASLIAVSSSYAFTASSAISASNALTASYVPASAVVGLNLSQIATGSVTASVGLTSSSFQLVSGSTTFLYVSNSGNFGFGTTTPNALAHIHEVSNGLTNLLLEETGATNAAQILFKNTTRTWEIGGDSSPDGFYIHLQNGAQDYLFINPNGNIGIGKTTPTARLDVSGSVLITGSLSVSGSVSGSSFTGSFTGSLFGTASQATSASYSYTASSAISSSYAFTASSAINAFSSSFALTASYVNPLRQNVIISGSLTVSASTTALSIQGSGSNVFTVDGTSGRLFEIDDSLSGSLFSVNTISGLPVIEAFSDNRVNIGKYNQEAIRVSSSFAFMTGSLFGTSSQAVSASYAYTASSAISASYAFTASSAISASFAQSASFVLNAVSSSYAYTASSAISASYAYTASSAVNATNALSASSFTITSTLNFDGTLTDYNAIASTIVGTNNVFAQSTGSYRSGFFKYTAINGTNARTGEVMVAWNGANIVFTDFATTDIGATNDVTMSVALAAGTVQFNAITQGSGWNIRSIGTYM